MKSAESKFAWQNFPQSEQAPNLKKQQRNVVSVHNTSDHNCLLYFYYTAYHAQPKKPPLYNPEQQWRKKAQISTFDQKLQPNLMEINGDYQMLMSLFDIEQFELLNNVQIIVFPVIQLEKNLLLKNSYTLSTML